MYEHLEKNIALWQERIGNASARWGKAEICAATKTVDADTINRAYAAGIRIIGENRVQELNEKVEFLNPEFEIHMIGGLQTNKVKALPERLSMVQSLDRLNLAEALSKRQCAQGKTLPVLIEINVSGEEQRSGVLEENFSELFEAVCRLPNLKIDGLMAIMPIADDPEALRPYFRSLRARFDRLRDAGYDLHTLSMGMSGDCLVAAEEGATMVRLGRALFGERPVKR